jgi:hypothetical protein
MGSTVKSDLAKARVVKFLEHGSAVLRRAAREGEVVLDGGDVGHICVDRALLTTLLNGGDLVASGNAIRLAEQKGRADRPGKAVPAHRTQHKEKMALVTETGMTEVCVNTAESPLGSLWRHKGKSGQRFLTASEFNAGERLRLEYTRGQIMPRLGINWSAAGTGAKNRGDANRFGDMTDSALAARDRVEAAIEAVGPELAGVLIDVCCFLKGLERVEAERGWPVRSGKVVLKSALSALARHYEPPRRATSGKVILHWGAADYRPQVSQGE